MDKLSVDHLLGIKFLKKSDINLIFKTALHFKEVLIDHKKSSYFKGYNNR
ncbi:MAG: hypothetical protein CM15mP102_05260 [Flavobacteriales bacterium]|nr:MAG: hypothetical protein CM15mP102_05260 [Flavobacteriales bacterium]